MRHWKSSKRKKNNKDKGGIMLSVLLTIQLRSRQKPGLNSGFQSVEIIGDVDKKCFFEVA